MHGSAKTRRAHSIKSLGTDAKLLDKPIRAVELLGAGKPTWKQEATALTLTCPNAMPLKHAAGFKISF